MVLFHDAPLSDGQTVIPLPFSYTIGGDELLVTYNGNVLTLVDDYVEAAASTIVLTAAVLASDHLGIRKLGAGGGDASDNGLVTSANIIGGVISVSFAASSRVTGLTDLVFEVRDPSNVQAAVSVPLTEYFTTGVYYGSVDVGVANLGAHFIHVTSITTPENNAVKIFNVSPSQSGGSSVIQEATRTFGDSMTFRHIAQPSLSDVEITIYDSADVPISSNQPMLEIGSSGVYKFVFNPPTAGLFTGIMTSPSISTKSVTEVIFAVEVASGGSTVISNRVGVGRREDC